MYGQDSYVTGQAVIKVMGVGGGGCNGSGGIFSFSTCDKSHKVTQNYAGSPCKEFGEPQTTTQNIKM